MPADATADQALARAAQAGDAGALERLVRRYVRAVYAIAASVLLEPADVEDAAQDAFLRALRAIQRYDPRRPFAPWLYQIARNTARTRRAAIRARRTDPPDDRLPSPLPGPDTAAELGEIRARVLAAMRLLPERRRMAFYLSDVEGYTTEDVAEMMGVSAGAVRAHLYHARRALRTALHELREGVAAGTGAVSDRVDGETGGDDDG